MKSTLTFFVTLNKQTDEFILQEGTLLNLKIPKSWQKPDTSVKRPALWVCHLPANSLGIVYISLYPTELVIKKEIQESKVEEEYDFGLVESKEQKENFLVYKGTLEPNGETEKETFFRCRLKLQKKKEVQPPTQESFGVGNFIAVMIFIFIVIIIIGFVMKVG